MKLSPPKQITWIIALVLVVLALLVSFGVIPAFAATYAFWFALLAAALLLIATITKGL